jgi:hypothetical protein
VRRGQASRDIGVPRLAALSYQITVHYSSAIVMTCDDCLFVVCLLRFLACIGANGFGPGGTPKIVARFGRIGAAHIL